MKPTRVLIADDHEVLRDGLRLVLEREPGCCVCGIARTGKEAVERSVALKPDIVILDISMPELNGLEAGRQIKRALPDTELLIFTASENDNIVRQIFDAGAKSYIRKSDAAAHLLDAIRSLREHKPFFTNQVSEVLFNQVFTSASGCGRTETPSDREREVVRLLSDGKSNKEVAASLGISPRTVEVHRATAMKKVGVKTFSELIRWAIRNGIVNP